MKIRNLFILMLAFGCFNTINAQKNLVMKTKNGTELTGFISSQKPGLNFSFSSSKALVVLPSEYVKSIIPKRVKYVDLSKEWKSWADDNDAVYTTKDNINYVNLSTIITKDKTIDNVRLIESGVKIKYLEIALGSYTLNWDTISVVNCNSRDERLLTGLNRKYKLKSGIEYEGQYVEEIPGETISLLCENGITQVINTIDIVKDSRVKVNPDQDILEQSDLLDVIHLNNGDTYTGLIYERNYFGFDDVTTDSIKIDKNLVKHDFLLIRLEDGSTRSIELSDIAAYDKKINLNYNPIVDVILEKGTFMVNRHKIELQDTKEKENIIGLPCDSVKQEFISNNSSFSISIESKFVNQTDSRQFKLVKATKYSDKKKKNFYYGFTYEDILRKEIQPKNCKTSLNGTTKLDFVLPDKGVYIFYNAVTRKSITFILK